MSQPSVSDFLLTYRQYKDDTDSIAGWLAQNAVRCEYKVTLLEQPKPMPTITSDMTNEPNNIRAMLQSFMHPKPMLKYNPVQCDILKYHLFQQLHDQAVTFDNALLMMTDMIHLYVACRLSFPEDPVWPDMEFLIACRDTHYLFFGGLPTTLKECVSKLGLACGGPPTAMARNRQPSKIKMNPDKLRLVKNGCPLGRFFADWFCNDGHPDAILPDLLLLLNDPKYLNMMFKIGNIDEDNQKKFKGCILYRTKTPGTLSII
ncbi:hypothetical protein F5Y16DRAFT_394591 [Xylariaceae sp. FL0255]|nr:hypothetical protein F5Y16DRAFT_394591 [Xylariaceae sp. FL0255]